MIDEAQKKKIKEEAKKKQEHEENSLEGNLETVLALQTNEYL